MKKLVLIGLILIAFVLILNATDLKDAKVYSVSDTTTASYVSAVTENTGAYKGVTFVIKNTGSNSIYWKVDSYATFASSNSIPWLPETSIAAGASDYITVTREVWDKYVISVKNNAGASTYTIDVILQKK